MSVVSPAAQAEYPPLEELIHQRGEMLLLDRLLERGPAYVVVAAKLLPRDHPLLDAQQGMPIWVGIELMAQAVAVYSGLDQRDRGLSPRIGLLLGTRSFNACVSFVEPEQQLLVRAELTWSDNSGLGVFACELGDGHNVLATAQVKGYVPEDIRAHLGETLDG